MKDWARRIRRRLGPRSPETRNSVELPPVSLKRLEDWTLLDSDLKQWSRAALSVEARSWLYEQGSQGDLVREIVPGLFELQGFFDASWWSRLDEEIRRVCDWTAAENVLTQPPNSMHYGGFELAPLGLDTLVDQLSCDLITPLARRLYPDREWPELSDGHGFLADYGPGADRDLSLHVDDSDVTLTLCLGEEFEGSEVVFEGIRCPLHQQSIHRPEERVFVTPTPGVALVHLGAHRHRVAPLLRGTRQSLIVWARGLHTQDQRMGIGLTDCPDWCDE